MRKVSAIVAIIIMLYAISVTVIAVSLWVREQTFILSGDASLELHFWEDVNLTKPFATTLDLGFFQAKEQRIIHFWITSPSGRAFVSWRTESNLSGFAYALDFNKDGEWTRWFASDSLDSRATYENQYIEFSSALPVRLNIVQHGTIFEENQQLTIVFTNEPRR